MKQENKRLYSMIFAALLIAAALVMYFDLIVPTYNDLLAVKGQELGEETLYNNEQKIVDQVNQLQASYQNQTAAIASIDMALPVGQNVASGLAQIYGLAAPSGVVVQGTTVAVQTLQQQVVAPPSSDGIASAATVGSIKKPVGSITFTVTGSGSYGAIKSFLKGLETNMRVFDVSAISVTGAPIQATKTIVGNPDFFTYAITVATYYQAP